MNRSYSKIRHIQEANQRLEKRLMSEQVPHLPMKQMEPEVDQFDDTDIRSKNFNLEKKVSLDKKKQIQDIIDNFDSISCDGVNFVSAESLLGEKPERDILYCLYYKGKSKEDLIQMLNSL